MTEYIDAVGPVAVDKYGDTWIEVSHREWQRTAAPCVRLSESEAVRRYELRPRSGADAALRIAAKYGQVVGAHHQAWVIDQMARALTGDAYEAWVARQGGSWDEGTAP